MTPITQRLLFAFIALTFVPLSILQAKELPTPQFVAQTIDDSIKIGYGLAIGDVDGDKRDDVLLADARQIVWYRNPGDADAAWTKHLMAQNLTARDNVCIAARDINGDGKVEVAVGAAWNPGETNDTKQSGAVFYLIRPEDPTQRWEAVPITPHEPTTHRMHWVQVERGRFQLVVLPLHGRGNKGGQGDGVRVLAYNVPKDPRDEWSTELIDDSMHMTHNFDAAESWDGSTPKDGAGVCIAGREGFRSFVYEKGGWKQDELFGDRPAGKAAGEVRMSRIGAWSTVEPMHGNQLVVYTLGVGVEGQGLSLNRHPLADDLAQGHALAFAPILPTVRFDNHPQVVVGWRSPNAQRKVGIRLYVGVDKQVQMHVIDDNTMACEDLKVADLDGDQRPDIIAAGRTTKNVVIYWNRTTADAVDR